MAKCEFRVSGVSVEPNIRGQAMRRIHLAAIDSEAFRAGELPEGQPSAGPDGHISILVGEEFADGLALGDEAYLVFQRGQK